VNHCYVCFVVVLKWQQSSSSYSSAARRYCKYHCRSNRAPGPLRGLACIAVMRAKSGQTIMGRPRRSSQTGRGRYTCRTQTDRRPEERRTLGWSYQRSRRFSPLDDRLTLHFKRVGAGAMEAVRGRRVFLSNATLLALIDPRRRF
jgi:hypothetical protein